MIYTDGTPTIAWAPGQPERKTERPRIVVSYGPEGRYQVEFRLNGRDEIEGRYLPGLDGVGRPSEWDVREPDEDDPERVAVLGAIHHLLASYAETI